MLHFDYRNVVWDTVIKGLADRLQKLQNHSARIITRSFYEIRPDNILERLRWKKNLVKEG